MSDGKYRSAMSKNVLIRIINLLFEPKSKIKFRHLHVALMKEPR